jgi:hypothetical protein
MADLFATRNDESCTDWASSRHHCSSVSTVVNALQQSNPD